MRDVNAGVPSETQKGESTVPEEIVPTPQAGEKTDPNLLLKSLQEEREKRRLLEQQVQELQDSISSVSSDSGDEDMTVVKSEIADLKRRLQKSEVLEAYPLLKEIWADFDEFRSDPENKGMAMRTAAKAFLTEKGLIESPPRKGLEKPTGGQHIPLSTGMSAEDVKTLRETNYKKYVEMLQKGQIKIGA